MKSNIFNDDFLDLIKAFNECEVEYVLVGGYAVILHGYSRTTGDLDLMVNPTKGNYLKIVKAFMLFGMPLFGMTEEKFLDINNYDVFEYGLPPSAIDIITKMKEMDFAEVYANAFNYIFEDEVQLNVIHFDTLIKIKEKVKRPKDISDIIYLNKNKKA